MPNVRALVIAGGGGGGRASGAGAGGFQDENISLEEFTACKIVVGKGGEENTELERGTGEKGGTSYFQYPINFKSLNFEISTPRGGLYQSTFFVSNVFENASRVTVTVFTSGDYDGENELLEEIQIEGTDILNGERNLGLRQRTKVVDNQDVTNLVQKDGEIKLAVLNGSQVDSGKSEFFFNVYYDEPSPYKLASVGGGGGASQYNGNAQNQNDGGDGASGGGGEGAGSGYDPGDGGDSVPGQGHDGGNGDEASSSTGGGGNGGGGGAGGPGVRGRQSDGSGGPGKSSDITGTNVTYAGGGSSGPRKAGEGADNYGGGGNRNERGKDGVVIVRYKKGDFKHRFKGGIITEDGDDIIHTFESDGTLEPITTATGFFMFQ